MGRLNPALSPAGCGGSITMKISVCEAEEEQDEWAGGEVKETHVDNGDR